MDAEDDDVAERVKSAAEVENIGVLEGDLLGDLHHTKDDDQVGAVHMLESGIRLGLATMSKDMAAARCSRGGRRAVMFLTLAGRDPL